MKPLFEDNWKSASALLLKRQESPLAGVYKIVNTVNGKVYVGQSTHLKKRISEGHIYKLRRGNHGNRFLQRSWNKYGEDSFEYYYIVADEFKELTPLEEFWIRRYDSCNNKKGYNMVLASDSTYGFRHTEESKEKIRIASTGKNNPNYGKPMSEERKAQLLEIHQVKIAQFDFNRNLIKVWDSIKQAADYYNIDRQPISIAARNITGSSCGFYWAYYDEYLNGTIDFEKKESIRIKGKSPVVQLTLSGEFVNAFESIADAERHTGLKNIRNGLVKNRASKGYKWMYKRDYDKMVQEGLSYEEYLIKHLPKNK